MRRGGGSLKAWRNLLLATAEVVALAILVVVGALTATRLRAQSAPGPQQPAEPQWQIDAGGKAAFDVASVKQNKLDASEGPQDSNVALGPGDYYTPNGGFLRATNIPLFAYITFAFKATANQHAALFTQLPEWARADRFDIQARAAGNPTKDQMRLMMQALLSDRFKLATHYETRQVPVFGLVLAKAGKTGPQLVRHPADAPCTTVPPAPAPSTAASAPTAPVPGTVAGGFPVTCGGIQPMASTVPGRVKTGARNVTMQLIASTLPAMGNSSDRPILDETGLSGTFDFTLEWAAAAADPGAPAPPTQADENGPTFLEALQEQLGLKLKPQTGPVTVLVVDHIEEPSPN